MMEETGAPLITVLKCVQYTVTHAIRKVNLSAVILY